MSLILTSGDFYCSVCHLDTKGSRGDGLVEPVVSDEGIVIGLRCSDCFKEWRII